MEEQKKQIKKGWKIFWSIVGTVLFISYFALLGVLIFFRQGRTHYLDGLNGTFIGYARYFYSIFLWLLMIPVFGLTLTYVCIVKSFFGISKGFHHLRIVLLVILLVLNYS
ncbi:MAG: hypothetical protein ISS71_09695 [Phycisphaerae bacterium]|nr:hypothetical protein [Phycisphaerae bacterium]